MGKLKLPNSEEWLRLKVHEKYGNQYIYNINILYKFIKIIEIKTYKCPMTADRSNNKVVHLNLFLLLKVFLLQTNEKMFTKSNLDFSHQ